MSQVTTYRERREVVVRAYAAGGCPIHVGKQKCGETKGLDIIMDFHKLYQEKMSQIDVSAGGDTLQAKVDLQQDWINDLTEQNKMLARVIEELESEAIGRVQVLEEKLKNAAKSFGEEESLALAERDKKIKELEEALKTLPIMTVSEKVEETVRPIQPTIPFDKKSEEQPLPSTIAEKPQISKTPQPSEKKEIIIPATPKKEKVPIPQDTKQEPEPIAPPAEVSVQKEESAKKPSEPEKLSVSPQSDPNPDADMIVQDNRLTETVLSVPSDHNNSIPEAGRAEELIAQAIAVSQFDTTSPDGKEPLEESSEAILVPISQDSDAKASSKTQTTSSFKSSMYGKNPSRASLNLDKKSVHLVIENGTEPQIVEPEKNPGPHQELQRPHLDSVPVVGTNDSIELKKGISKTLDEVELITCVCAKEDVFKEMERLKEENKMLREGGEILRLKDEIEEKMLRILQLNEENRALNNMINSLRENQALKGSQQEREEYEQLKQKIKLLEEGRGDTENITTNLQTAVDLYVNTIQLLEGSEQKLKTEVEQYRLNNEATQDNIISLKQTMEKMKQQFQEEIERYQKIHQQLLDLNYELEMEHINSLQDISMMETQFHKYQSFLKEQEDDKMIMKTQLKKLSKKNKCYEEVVQFFKEEMSVMSDELLTLQEVLNVTNVNSQEENNKLITAILQLRRINERLMGHLCAIEKQVVLENQINQINEARINELQQIIGTKNYDLSQHDELVQEMKKKLATATKQNIELKKTIKNLTETVVEIQEGIKSVEKEQRKNKTDVSAVESRVCLASGDLQEIKACMEQKNKKIADLENILKSQEISMILATKELGVLKDKKNNQKEIIKTLREQLAVSEKKAKQVIGDYQVVAQKLQDYTSLDHMKNYELGHYKGLVEEMRVSMADMKRRLSEANFRGGLIEEELLKVKESHMTQIQEEVTESQKELQKKILSTVEEQSQLNRIIELQKEEIEKLKRDLQNEKEDLCCCKRSVSELKNEKMNCNAQKEITHLRSELGISYHRQRLLNEENDKIHTQMINLRKKLTMMEHAYEVLKQEHEETKNQLKKSIRDKEYLVHKNEDLSETMEKMKSTHEQLEKQCRYTSDCVRNLELELSEVHAEKDDISSEAQKLCHVIKMWLQEQNTVNGQIRGKFHNYHETIHSLQQTIMKRMSEERSWIKTPMQQPFSPRRYGTTPQSDRRSPSPARSRKSEKHTSDTKCRASSPWRCLSAYLEDGFIPEDSQSHRSKLLRNISYESNSSPYSSRTPSPMSNSLHEEEEADDINLNDWFSPNYKETDTDADEMDEEPLITKVHMMTTQIQEANKKWQQKMNKGQLCRYRANKNRNFDVRS